MKLRPITTKQFAWWLAVTAFAVLIWIAVPELIGLYGGLFGFSSIILASKSGRNDELSKKQICTTLLGLVVIIPLVIVLTRRIPDYYESSITQFVQQPAFILPVWILSIYFVHLRWKLRRNQCSEENQKA